MSYTADADGFRVTKMESRPIGDGPKTDKYGRAIVQSYVGGVETQYAIKAEPADDAQEGREDGGATGGVKLVELTAADIPSETNVEEPVQKAAVVKISEEKSEWMLF